MVTPGGLEPPAYGLGNRRSVLLSYGVTRGTYAPKPPHFASQRQERRPGKVRSGFPSGRATNKIMDSDAYFASQRQERRPGKVRSGFPSGRATNQNMDSDAYFASQRLL